MKKCLWCQRNEKETYFETKAHTIPKSLGGKFINPNICDECNSYFGSRKNIDRIAVEEILKETFSITRRRIQESTKLIKSTKKLNRFKSRYFEIRERNGKPKLKIKQSFRLKRGFQSKICRYFKRGIYKLYLEELNRQKSIGFEEQYHFIREFARYNLGNYPIFYFERRFGAILLLNHEGDSPKLIFDRMNYLVSDYGFTEIEFLGHVFGFPIRRLYELEIEKYLKKSIDKKKKLFKRVKEIKYLTDVDLMFSVMNN